MDIYNEVFKCGILKMRLRENDLTASTLESYQGFCRKIIHDNPMAGTTALCNTASLGLRFFVEFPEKNIPISTYTVSN